MTKNMKTLCIGRFLIDLPDETRLELRGPRIDGFDISSSDEPEADFQVRLERSAASDARLTLRQRWRISDLRTAPRTIAGITGDEVVTRYAEMNDTVGYSFWWEVNGTEDNVYVPHFVFKMTTGEGENEPVPTSLSEDAAMAFWDKITSSIRFHTPSPAKGKQPAAPAGVAAKPSR